MEFKKDNWGIRKKKQGKKKAGRAAQQPGPASRPVWPAQTHGDIAVTSPVGGRSRGGADVAGVAPARGGTRGGSRRTRLDAGRPGEAAPPL